MKATALVVVLAWAFASSCEFAFAHDNSTVDADVDEVSDEELATSKLFSDLFSKYNKSLKPRSLCKNPSDVKCPFTVQARLFLIRIQDVVETSETLVTSVRLQLGWVDRRLKWDPSKYNGVDSLTLPGNLLWFPDLQIANSIDDMYVILANPKVGFRLTSDGQVWYHPTGKISTRCTMDLTFYPFDYQLCSIVVESVIFPSKELQVMVRQDKPDPVSLGMYTDNRSWRVKGTSGYTVSYKTGEKTALSRAQFWILLKRDPTYYVQSFLIPIALLSGLLVTTYLQPMHTNRVSQATVVMLTTFLLESYIAEKLPKSSQMSLVQTYLNLIVGMSVATICISILTFEIYEPDEGLNWWGIPILKQRWKRRKQVADLSSICNANSKTATDVTLEVKTSPEPPTKTEDRDDLLSESTPKAATINNSGNDKSLPRLVKIAAVSNFAGFVTCVVVFILYPTIAFCVYVISSPPDVPTSPPNNITTKYYPDIFGGF